MITIFMAIFILNPMKAELMHFSLLKYLRMFSFGTSSFLLKAVRPFYGNLAWFPKFTYKQLFEIFNAFSHKCPQTEFYMCVFILL